MPMHQPLVWRNNDYYMFNTDECPADQVTLLPHDYASIQIVFNKFLNAQSYEPIIVEAFSEDAIKESPQFSQFEIDEEVLSNLSEYALANSLYWALAEGHACEQSARRNAMDNASKNAGYVLLYDTWRDQHANTFQRHDQQIPDFVQSYSTSCHHWRAGGDYHRRYSLRGHVEY